MKNENEKFIYNYSAPTTEERREIETIVNQYLPKDTNKSTFEQLKELNKKVKRTPRIVSLVMGIVGVLIFGLGLSMILEWQIFVWGVVVCIVGIIPVSLAYFVYKAIYRLNKAKYGDKIVELGNELLNNSGE